MQPRFEQFIRERQYLPQRHAVNGGVVQAQSQMAGPSESHHSKTLRDAVIRMSESGRKATGCNCALLALSMPICIGASAGAEWQRCGPAFPKHPKIAQLKEPDLCAAHVHRATDPAACHVEAQGNRKI